MGYIVIRRFRGGEDPASTRVYQQEAEARARARAWIEEGWDVEMVSASLREPLTGRLETPPPMPARPNRRR